MPAGRKFKYDPNKPELIENRIEEYFSRCEERQELPLFPELLLFLDITRPTWYNYLEEIEVDTERYNNDNIYRSEVDNKRRIFTALKKAEARLEAAMSREAVNSKSSAAIFLLKQKFYGGYTDKQEVQAIGDVKISVKLTDDKGKSI